MTLIWIASMLNLSNMASTAGAQFGSSEKKIYALGFKWSKFACGAIWTIIWLNPLTIVPKVTLDTQRWNDNHSQLPITVLAYWVFFICCCGSWGLEEITIFCKLMFSKFICPITSTILTSWIHAMSESHNFNWLKNLNSFNCHRIN